MIAQATGLPRHATKVWSRRTSPPSLVCIHHSATSADVTPYAIARYHVETKDMPSAQYHYLIDAAGTIWQSNDDSLFVWHGHDHNVGLGVCLIGNFTDAHPTPKQIEAVRWLYAEKQREHGTLRLVGHKSAPRATTECPGQTWLEWRDSIREERATMNTTKMCPHVLQGYSGVLGEPPMVKLVNPSFEYIRQVRDEIGPEPMLIVRWTVDGEPWAEWMKAPEQSAEHWFTTNAATIRACVSAGLNVAFEGANEVPGELSGPYARHELRRVQIMHRENAPSIVINSGVGEPPLSMMRCFEPVLAELGQGDAVGDHWYWIDEENLLANIQGTPWHNRAVFGDWLKGCVIVYTEGGRDYLPDLKRGGPWQNTTHLPQYQRERRICDDWMCSRDDVVGMAEFTIGTPWDAKWKPYLCNSFWPSVVQSQRPWTPTWAKYWPPPVDPEEDIVRAVVDAAHNEILPLNPDAALYKAAKLRDAALMPASDEFYVPYSGDIIAQSFRRADDDRMIYTAWTREGEWSPEQVRWIEHAN